MNLKKYSDFHQDLLNLIKSYEDVHLKIEDDLDSNIFKIFGGKMSALARAQNGLDDTIELAYTTAEHHPYWNLLYHCCQISKTTLDRWESKLTKEELDEIDWSIKELLHTLEKLKKENC